jgi:hypothetical protein
MNTIAQDAMMSGPPNVSGQVQNGHRSPYHRSINLRISSSCWPLCAASPRFERALNLINKHHSAEQREEQNDRYRDNVDSVLKHFFLLLARWG